MKKNVASQVIGAQMVSASDGSAFTGTATVVITGDGGTQSASGGTGPTHEGNGFHTYVPTQAETNYDHIGFTFTGSGAVPVTIQVYTTFPQTGDGFARLGAPAGASIAADIATVDTVADGIQTDLDNGTDGLGALLAAINGLNDPTAATIAAAVWDALQSSHVTAGSFGEVATEVASILADTNELQGDWVNGGRLDLLVDAIKAVTDNLPDSGALTTIGGNVTSILDDTGTSGVVVAGTPDVNVAQISGSATAADNLEESTEAVVPGQASGTPSTTSIPTNLSSYTTNDTFNGRVIVFKSGAAAGEATDITDYDGTTQTLTVTALAATPSSGDLFVIV